MLRAPLIQLEYTLKHWKSTFSYSLYRAQHLPWATALKIQRHCTKEELYTTKQSLRPLKAVPVTVSTVTKRDRAAAKVSLKDVLYIIKQIARAAGQLQDPAYPINVLVATDAAPLWKSSATRTDCFVDVWGGGRDCRQSGPMEEMVRHG